MSEESPRRRTKLMIEAEKRKILDYMATGASDAAIMHHLNIPERMYHRGMKSIRQDHLRQVLDSQSAQAKASILVQCMEKMKWLEMEATNIVANHNIKEIDRLQAMDRVRQFKIDQAKLFTEGPTIFRVVPRDGLHIGTQGTAALIGDTPAIPEAVTTTDNGERQF